MGVQHDERADASDEQAEHQRQAVEPPADVQAQLRQPFETGRRHLAREHRRRHAQQQRECGQRYAAGRQRGEQAARRRIAAPDQGTGGGSGQQREQYDSGEKIHADDAGAVVRGSGEGYLFSRARLPGRHFGFPT